MGTSFLGPICYLRFQVLITSLFAASPKSSRGTVNTWQGFSAWSLGSLHHDTSGRRCVW